MTTTQDLFDIITVSTVEIASDAHLVELPAGLELPSKLFLIQTEETDLGDSASERSRTRFDVTVTAEFVNGRFACTELSVRRRPGGPEVTGEAIRSIPVKQLATAAVFMMVQEVRKDLKGGKAHISLADWATPPKGIAAQGPTPEVIRWVAQTYRLAEMLGVPPTKSVQDGLGISRATAGRWVAEARRDGLLEGVPGDEDQAARVKAVNELWRAGKRWGEIAEELDGRRDDGDR